MIYAPAATQYDESSEEALAKPCAFQGCQNTGDYPAPRNRDNLSEHIWFCLKHIRAYNAGWNYYAGMNVGEIESHWRGCATWERPTWPIGSHPNFSQAHEAINEYLRKFTANINPSMDSKSTAQSDAHLFPPGSTEARALKTLKLSGQITNESMKIAYKKMVKKYHPDTNHGCKQSEEKLKEINQAYGCLKAVFRN